jgi:hypothetical protein
LTFFCGFHLLLWIFERVNNSGSVASSLAFVVFEEFHLPQALFGFFSRLVRAAEIFAFLLGNHFVPAFYFFDHVLPSRANFRAQQSAVNTTPAVDLLASGGFLRYVLHDHGGAK